MQQIINILTQKIHQNCSLRNSPQNLNLQFSTMSGWDSDYRYEPEPLFQYTFRCRPVDEHAKPEMEAGNRIIMPASSLSIIDTLPVRFPLFFKIESIKCDKTSHCGVLEFTAEEGFVLMPRWMMKNLSLEDGDDVVLKDASLSAGLYMKLRPHATAFVEVSNPRAVLETALRRYACLSRGDTIMIRYGVRDYYLDVLEVNPGGEAVSLIETDCVLEFAPPLDYVEPSAVVGVPARAAAVEEAKEEEKDGGKDERKEEFQAFTGRGRVLGRSLWAGAAESGGRSGVGRDPPRAAVVEGNKIEKDGGKEGFKAFSGKSRVLGGPSLDAAAESNGWSVVARGPVAEGNKREKDDANMDFKAFSGKGHVIGGPLLN